MTIDKQKQLTAILYILTELYNFRVGLKNDNIAVNVDIDIKNEVIKEINSKFGLDFHNVKSLEDRLKYEEFVNKYLTLVLNSNKNPNIDDEINLLKKTVSINPKEIRFKKPKIDKPVLDFLKIVKISTVGINSWFENPDYIKLLKTDEKLDYICTKKVKINGVSKILLYHISDDLFNTEINSLFILNFIKFDDMLNNPIRLFLYVLNEYGVDIKINNTTKKFHLSIDSPANQIEFLNLPKTHIVSGYFLGKQNPKDNYKYTFAYAINIKEYTEDYINGRI